MNEGERVKQYIVLCASGMAFLLASSGGPRRASAAELPNWCGKHSYEANSADVNALKRSEPEYIVRTISTVLCSNTSDAVPVHGKAEELRKEWSKKLGMVDADWADAVAFIDNRDGNYPKVELSTKVIAQFTPMDQWWAIREGLKAGDISAQGVYAADMMHGGLSEVGRMAFIEFCLKERLEHAEMPLHAVCASDIAAWDAAKFATQLRGDTVHDGGTRMLLRLRAYALGDTLTTYASDREKLFKKDDAYKLMVDVASKARAAWEKGIGTNTSLLELMQTMDSASLSGSRKLFSGCEEKTQAALVAAISKIPAKAFSGMTDVRDDPFGGFAKKAGPVLVNNPEVNIAANAWAQCHRQTPTADFLMASLQEVPGFRGPRAAAYAALLNEKFVFDDVNARAPQYPRFYDDVPYRRSGGSLSSAGGVVDKVTQGKEHATVALQKTTAKRVDCVKSHRTNRVLRISSDGRVDYEAICDKTAVVTYDTTWTDFKVNPAHVPLLKKGVVFSGSSHNNSAHDILAIWKDKNATVPMIVLGAPVK